MPDPAAPRSPRSGVPVRAAALAPHRQGAPGRGRLVIHAGVDTLLVAGSLYFALAANRRVVGGWPSSAVTKRIRYEFSYFRYAVIVAKLILIRSVVMLNRKLRTLNSSGTAFAISTVLLICVRFADTTNSSDPCASKSVTGSVTLSCFGAGAN